MFFLAEYTHVITISFLTAILFFGGWHFPWIAEAQSDYFGAVVVKIAVLLTKVGLIIAFIMLYALDASSFPFRPTDEFELESLHSAFAVQLAGNDDRQAVRSLAVVDAIVFDRAGGRWRRRRRCF